VSDLPLLLRLLLALHRGTLALERAARELLQAAAWALVPAGRRDAVTQGGYARLPTYLPGGATFERGLFAYEALALTHPAWPRAGKVLVGGAGGGREVKALLARGHAVRAFEPVEPLAAACAGVCRAGDGACLVGAYADLAAAARGEGGPLAPLVAEAPYDAVWLGWGSLAHVTEPERVEAIFAAARRLAPAGPLFTNFYPRAVEGRGVRLAARLDRLLRLLGAPGRRPEGGVFHPQGAFVVTHTRDALAAVAARHGYAVAAGDREAPGWLLFVPDGKPGEVTSAPSCAAP
jgi:hypothetical protein